MDSLESPSTEGEELPEKILASGGPAPSRASVGSSVLISHRQESGEYSSDGDMDLLEEVEERDGRSNSAEQTKNAGSGTQELNPHLEEFRQQWQQELQEETGSREQSPRYRVKRGEDRDSSKVTNNKEEELECQARDFFLKGMQAEDDRMLDEAIYYYRKALQLVPDIESKLGQAFNRSPRDRLRQDSESSIEGSEIEEDLVTHFENLRVEDEPLCKPEYEQRMTHISALPIEVLNYILRWVVSTELDLRSMEMVSRVCRGFFMCVRDEQIWKQACEKVWGANLGKAKKYDGSWRKMIIERPHMLFEGCYISKVTYIRQGEQGLDQFYRPFHMVEYYRFFRFFPEGHVLMFVSPEDPLQSLPKLKHRYSKAVGLLRGGYRLSDSKVTCVLKRVKSEPTSNYTYKRQRQQAQQANQNEPEMSYCVEMQVQHAGRKPNAQLVWQKYSIRTVNKNGEENFTDFNLDRSSFPPLIFSRVKNYMALSSAPLGRSLNSD